MWPFKYPYTNFHELNLDWILEEVKDTKERVDNFNVQEEVDNKLDSMLADGSLAGSVAEAISELDSFIPNAKYPPNGFTACKGDGVTDDSAAIQALIDSFGAIAFPKGEYIVNSTIISRQARIIGASKGSVYIRKKTHGAVFNIGDRSTLSDLNIGFGDIEPVEGDDCIRLTGTTYPYQRGYIRNVILLDCWCGIHGEAGSAPFSCLFETIEIGRFRGTGIDIEGNAETQNLFINVYINQGSNEFQLAHPAESHIKIRGVYSGSTFINCNFEHATVTSPVHLIDCVNFNFFSCHFEGVKLRKNYSGLIKLENTSAYFLGLSAVFNRLSNTGASIIEMGGDYTPIYGSGTSAKTLVLDGVFLSGLNSPDLNMYPNYASGQLPDDFRVVYRANQHTGDTNMYVRNYSYSTTAGDGNRYAAFPYTDWKIRLCEYGDLPLANNGVPSQEIALKPGQKYFDTGANVLKVYNGSDWV